MAGARPTTDLKRSCVAAFLSRLARGARDAVADEFGRHAGREITSAAEDLANAADSLAAFLHRAPGSLPPDAAAEFFISLQVFGLRLADALDFRLGANWHPTERGTR